MQQWQAAWLGVRRFPTDLTPFDLDQFLHLDDAALEAIGERRRPLHCLGIAVQIAFLQLSGRTLDSLQRVPRTVLRHLAEQLDIEPPDIASLRGIYKRRMTLHDHQAIAKRATGFHDWTQATERSLVAQLRREARRCGDEDDLVRSGMIWLFEHRFLLPRRRRLADLSRSAFEFVDGELRAEIDDLVSTGTRSTWLVELLAKAPGSSSKTVLEWLQEAPRSRKKNALDEHVARRDKLVALGASKLTLETVSAARRQRYAKRVERRRPASMRKVSEPLLTVELGCFLRQQLLRVTETAVDIAQMRASDLQRRARVRAMTSEASRLGQYRRLVEQIAVLRDDTSLSADAIRARLAECLAPFAKQTEGTRAAAVRRELANMSAEVRPFLRAVARLPLAADEASPLARALPQLRSLYAGNGSKLPAEPELEFPRVWQPFIDDPDRAAAMRGLEAASIAALHRGLRNGTVTLDESLSYQDDGNLFIPTAVWAKERPQHLKRLDLPRGAGPYLQKVRALLRSGLEQLDEARREGVITIEDGSIHAGELEAEVRPKGLKAFRRRLFATIGPTQFPDVMLEIDEATRFSWALLGRPPRRERELITVYAALIAHGSHLTPAEVVRMVPTLTPDVVAPVMARLEMDDTLREANEAVLTFMRQHAVTKLWGDGMSASSDMMSLETSRRLWLSRVDPRRRTFAVGTYTHVLDQWGVVYDQPIVLNKRQAGAAIEGALRQRQVDLDRVAVDTHGFTYAAMTFAKLARLDLCPRLAHLSDRKLFVPNDMHLPPALSPVADRGVFWRSIAKEWDALTRIAASIAIGWCPATLALARFGSAAQGNPTYEAAVALGKLLRTVYLCDFFGNPAFRRDIEALLSQGESIHTLQRAIYNGPIGIRRARTNEELAAASHSLALLTNIVMAYNTRWIERAMAADPELDRPEMVRHVAPTGFEHINLRGVFTFWLERYRDSLLDRAA